MINVKRYMTLIYVEEVKLHMFVEYMFSTMQTQGLIR